jgi:hypothetical protein
MKAFTGSALALLILLASARNLSAAPETCVDGLLIAGTTQAQTASMGGGKCTVMVGLSNKGTKYRIYSFSSTGSLQVFSQFAHGSNSTSTGAHVYFMFPRKHLPSASTMTTGDLEVVTASGQRARFDSATGALRALTGFNIWEDPEVTADNESGLSLIGISGIVLDCGYQKGNAPQANAARSSVFKDAEKHACSLPNRDIFTYPGGEPTFRFTTDAALASFLKTRCPSLNLSSIEPQEAPAPAPTAPAAADAGTAQ